MSSRSTAAINVCLILRRDHEVLLYLRKNTGYNDNLYGLVAGHVEAGESATDAMIREAYEEAGIHIETSDLKMVYVTHRQTDRTNIDLFFECSSWQGTIHNQEPEKCGELKFYPLNALPLNMIEYISYALQAIGKGEIYSESGWSNMPKIAF